MPEKSCDGCGSMVIGSEPLDAILVCPCGCVENRCASCLAEHAEALRERLDRALVDCPDNIEISAPIGAALAELGESIRINGDEYRLQSKTVNAFEPDGSGAVELEYLRTEPPAWGESPMRKMYPTHRASKLLGEVFAFPESSLQNISRPGSSVQVGDMVSLDQHRCTCGTDAAGGGIHSPWCDKNQA